MTADPTGRWTPAALLARGRSLWRGLRRRADVEAEMAEEFRHHLALRAEDLERAGLSPDEARRRARLEFGHPELHKADARASRGLHVLDQLRFSWLDVKLGLRMLVRYPGLTLVGGLAMAFAIAVGAGTFHFVNQFLDPSLPLPAGERIVGLRYWDRAEGEPAFPLPFDLFTWRSELRTVEHLGAYVTDERNLAVGDEAGTPVTVARMSPVGFRVAGVAPALGRALVEADAEAAAPPVVVLGHRVWQSRFAGDPAVVGRTVRLGEAQATVVGVMPEGYAFPERHELWVPLRLDASQALPASGTPLRVFGRLSPGATHEVAAADAGALLSRVAAQAPARFEHLRAQVLPYVESLSGRSVSTRLRVMIYQLNVFTALFLVLVSANVALLMFARTATREREIVVRAALGASRRRIVTQLFVEALVLTLVATTLGLAATTPALRWVERTLALVGGEMPFWFDPTVSTTTALYAGGLALLAAVVAGVVPALKATGRAIRSRLTQIGGGAGGLRLGGLWTAIVVTQIAATVVFTGAAFVLARQAERSATVETFFPAERYVGIRLEMDRADPAAAGDEVDAGFQQRYAEHVLELRRRLAEHPAVEGVTLAEQMPIKAHATSFVEVEDADARTADPARPEHQVFAGAVALDFFDVLRAPVLAGRAFDSRDLASGATAVIVTASFVDEVLGGRSAIGRRIRYLERDPAEEPRPWLEIVGVVRDLGTDRTRSLDLDAPLRARVYHPLDPGHAGTYPLHLVAHVRTSPRLALPAFHVLARRVSPSLRLHEPLTLDRANADLARLWRLYADVVTVVSGIALLLSLAGIYAVLSFTVARRTREIGVRVALGARPSRIVAEAFRGPLVQIASGVAVGCVLLAALVWALTGGRASARDAGLLLAWGVGMAAVCTLACVGPTLRALRIEPAEALGAEA